MTSLPSAPSAPSAPPSPSVPAPALSVVVCTYNRRDLAAQALDTLCRQTADPSRFEIVLVDNNSKDGTREMGEDFARRHAHVRYVTEPSQGLSHARNRGWREARGAYVGYFDDDAKAPAEWVAVALELIESRAPAAFGGPYHAFYDSPRPGWYRDEYGSKEMARAAGPLALDKTLSGGNLFVRRDILERLGGFDPSFGMSGGAIAYGEETVLQWRIQQEMPGAEIYYDPRLDILHLVRFDKMTFRWLLRQAAARGRYDARLAPLRSERPKPLARQAAAAAKAALRLGWRLTAGVWLRDRKRWPAPQNYVFEKILPQARRVAAFAEAARMAWRKS